MTPAQSSLRYSVINGSRFCRRSRKERLRIQSILNLRDVDVRRRRATNYLRKKGLPDFNKATDPFLKISFESGYMGLSLRAMKRFMPLLEKGFQYGALSSHFRYLPRLRIN